MRRKFEKIIIGMVVLISFFLSSTIITAEDPTLESFTIDPVEPAPLSDITVTADIGGEGISKVIVHIKECSHVQGICFSEQSDEMIELESGSFQVQFTLKEDNADYIQYYFDITMDGEVVRFDEEWTIDLKVDSSSNGSNGDNETPGFELIIFIAAIGVGLILFRKKRL